MEETAYATVNAPRAADLVDAEDRLPQVGEACELIAKENARLRDGLERLEERLRGVLNPHVLSEGVPVNAVPELERAPLADRLRSSANEIAQAARRVEALLDRIEV